MRGIVKRALEKPELAGMALLVLLVVAFQWRSNGVFLSADNVRGVLGILPEVALVAIGVTLLMICGEFDLSVGSVFALTPMAAAILMTHGWGFWPAGAAGLAIAAGIGVVNGLVTVRFGIPSFIATLGMLFIARSLTVVISGGFPPLLPDDIPSSIFTQFIGPGLLFRASFLWFLGVALAVAALLSLTNFGNWVKATGGFLEAARAVGIPTTAVKLGCFVICSVLAGFAGLITVLRLGSPLPSIGIGLELQAVAAAVIGGAALTGGIGTILGATVGALLIRVIDNGLVLSEVDANWFQLAIGALTIGAVVMNASLRRAGRRIRMRA